MAQTLIRRFGQKKAGWALGLAGLVLGTTVFLSWSRDPDSAGVQCGKADKKNQRYITRSLFGRAGIRICVVPPQQVLFWLQTHWVCESGTMMAVGIPVALISTVVAGIIWGKIINKIYTKLLQM